MTEEINSMKRKIAIICCLGLFAGFASFQFIPKQKVISGSSLYPEVSKNEMIDNASVIIRGTIGEVLSSKWSNPGFKKEGARNIIQTDIKINILEVYKGHPYDPNSITLRINEGKVGNTIMESDGYPDFKIGEELVLFLSKDDSDLANDDENYYVLTAERDAWFSLTKTIETETNEKIFSNPGKDSFKSSSIKKEIENTLEELKKNPLKKMTKDEIRKQNEKVLGK